MMGKTLHDRETWGPGIVDVQWLGGPLFGIRVERSLVLELKKLREAGGLYHSDPWSDPFCIEMKGDERSPQQALRRFKRIVEEAGMGALLQERERSWLPE